MYNIYFLLTKKKEYIYFLEMERSEVWTEYRSTALVGVKKYTSTANSYDVFMM